MEALQRIAETLSLPINEQSLRFPPFVGEGFIRAVPLAPGFSMSIHDVCLAQELDMISHNPPQNTLYQILFCTSENQFSCHVLDENAQRLSILSCNGIFFCTPGNDARVTIPPNERISFISFAVEREVLSEYQTGGGTEHNASVTKQTFMDAEMPIFIYEDITFAMHHVIQQLAAIKDSSTLFDRMMLHAKALELLGLFFRQIHAREASDYRLRLEPETLEKLFAIKQYITDNIKSPPSIPELAKKFGLNRNKLQQQFQQVFAKSIYQYVLYAKMSVARTMLETGRFSVSDVGFQMGYSNLGHFAAEFKRQFQVTPKEILKNSRSIDTVVAER